MNCCRKYADSPAAVRLQEEYAVDYRILAADDETELLDVLGLFLEREGIELIQAEDGKTAVARFREKKPHLVLLDIMMPGLDGYEVLRQIRRESKIPAIMLTARGRDYDKVLGLELGADDYITKPYNPIEVVARVKAQLRRYYDYGSGRDLTDNSGRELKHSNLILRPDEGALYKKGRMIPLTGTELRILELLMRNQGRIFTKQQIFDYAWDDKFLEDDNTIMVHISNLRSKLEDNPRQPRLLKTVKGLGYKFEKESPL